MNKKKVDKARRSAMERNDEYYDVFQREFDEKIATGSPEEGMSRMQILEKLLHAMNSDIKGSNLKFVSEMIDSIDESKLIESKKANS